jgi:hypothetical protein
MSPFALYPGEIADSAIPPRTKPIRTWFPTKKGRVLVKRDPYSAGWLNELAHAFSWGLALEREMRSILVVFRFPLFQFSSRVFFVPEISSSIELFRICFVAAFDLAVDFWASASDVLVRNTEVRKMPGELWSLTTNRALYQSSPNDYPEA